MHGGISILPQPCSQPWSDKFNHSSRSGTHHSSRICAEMGTRYIHGGSVPVTSVMLNPGFSLASGIADPCKPLLAVALPLTYRCLTNSFLSRLSCSMWSSMLLLEVLSIAPSLKYHERISNVSLDDFYVTSRVNSVIQSADLSGIRYHHR